MATYAISQNDIEVPIQRYNEAKSIVKMLTDSTAGTAHWACRLLSDSYRFNPADGWLDTTSYSLGFDDSNQVTFSGDNNEKIITQGTIEIDNSVGSGIAKHILIGMVSNDYKSVMLITLKTGITTDVGDIFGVPITDGLIWRVI